MILGISVWIWYGGFMALSILVMIYARKIRKRTRKHPFTDYSWGGIDWNVYGRTGSFTLYDS